MMQLWTSLFICCLLATVSGLPFVLPLLVQLSRRYRYGNIFTVFYVLLRFTYNKYNKECLLHNGFGVETSVAVCRFCVNGTNLRYTMVALSIISIHHMSLCSRSTWWRSSPGQSSRLLQGRAHQIRPRRFHLKVWRKYWDILFDLGISSIMRKI